MTVSSLICSKVNEEVFFNNCIFVTFVFNPLYNGLSYMFTIIITFKCNIRFMRYFGIIVCIFISFLNRLNLFSKYTFLAARIVCFNIVLYVFRFMLIIS